MDDRSRIDEFRDAFWGVSWGFLVPFTLAALPAALFVGDALASGLSFWVCVAWVVSLLIFPSLVTAWWLGWRDGKSSATRCTVVVRWVLLASLVPIAWAIVFARPGGVFGFLEYWMVGFHGPVYLVSRFAGWRSYRKERLAELEMAEAGAFAGCRCFLCRRRISGTEAARELASGQFVHKTCERLDWSGNLGIGPGWFVMATVIVCAVAYSWWPSVMAGSVLAFLRPSMVLVFSLGWAEGRVSGEGATVVAVYLFFLGRALVVFPLEILWLDMSRAVPVHDVAELEPVELFSLTFAAPVGLLFCAYFAAWFGGEILSTGWREVSGP